MSGKSPGPSLDPDLVHAHPIRVRYCETDRMGVAHHMNHVAWFEEARTGWFREQGLSYRELEDQGFLLQIVDMRIRYKAPLDFEDEVLVHTSLVERRRVGLTLAYRVERISDGVIAAEGETQLACVSPEGRIRALPASVFPGRG